MTDPSDTVYERLAKIETHIEYISKSIDDLNISLLKHIRVNDEKCRGCHDQLQSEIDDIQHGQWKIYGAISVIQLVILPFIFLYISRYVI
jgi:hypothetical protein